MWATNICWPSIRKLLHVALLVPENFEVAPKFSKKLCTPGTYIPGNISSAEILCVTQSAGCKCCPATQLLFGTFSID
jgi:hypothetical protein